VVAKVLVGDDDDVKLIELEGELEALETREEVLELASLLDIEVLD